MTANRRLQAVDITIVIRIIIMVNYYPLGDDSLSLGDDNLGYFAIIQCALARQCHVDFFGQIPFS